MAAAHSHYIQSECDQVSADAFIPSTRDVYHIQQVISQRNLGFSHINQHWFCHLNTNELWLLLLWDYYCFCLPLRFIPGQTAGKQMRTFAHQPAKSQCATFSSGDHLTLHCRIHQLSHFAQRQESTSLSNFVAEAFHKKEKKMDLKWKVKICSKSVQSMFGQRKLLH